MIAVAHPMQFRPTENKGKLCELGLNEPQSPSACPGNLVKGRVSNRCPQGPDKRSRGGRGCSEPGDPSIRGTWPRPTAQQPQEKVD